MEQKRLKGKNLKNLFNTEFKTIRGITVISTPGEIALKSATKGEEGYEHYDDDKYEKYNKGQIMARITESSAENKLEKNKAYKAKIKVKYVDDKSEKTFKGLIRFPNDNSVEYKIT